MEIRVDDLRGPEIAQLLREHLADFARHSPAESCHALDLDGLRVPEITFWSVWDGGELAGCGAIKDLGNGNAELKSMRTVEAYLRKGVGTMLLEHIMGVARHRGYKRISLETGAPAAFEPARQLYARFGFEVCGPFGSYREDPYSVYMTLAL